jgi:hypothetical protein
MIFWLCIDPKGEKGYQSTWVANLLLICNPRGQCWKFKILVKKKFNLLFKQYKMGKLAIGVSRDEKHKCKFSKSIDQW